MSHPLPARYDLLWRRRELAALLLLAAGAGAALGARSLNRAGWPGCPESQQTLRRQQAAERIDPNTASAGSLMRLPGIGASLAEAIIRHRQTARDGRPFRTLQDLDAVPGIGEGKIRELARHLQFLAIPEKP